MANLFSPDPLNTGGKRWDVLAKNSSQDGDYSWQSFDTAMGKNYADIYNQSFGWKNKDYALLALFDPMNVTRLDRHMENGYVLGNGTGHSQYTQAWEVNNIPQNYRTLKIVGNVYKDRATSTTAQWLTCRANNFSSTANNTYNSWWATSSTGTSNVTATSQWYFVEAWQEQYWSPGFFEIDFPGYSSPEVMVYGPQWYGRKNNRQTNDGYGYFGRGAINQQAQSPWNWPLMSLKFQMDSGYISGNSWIAIYGIK